MGAHGGTVQLVKRGAEVWMKPDTAFWKSQMPGGQGAAVAELFKDRYIHGTTQDVILSGLAGACDLKNFQREVGSGSSAGRTALAKGDETTIDGTKVIPLKGRQEGRQATLYVTSGSPHRLIRATQKGRGTDLTLAFTEYDKPVPSATPSPGETVDISKLRQELQNA